MIGDTPEIGSGPADPLKMREAWLSFVRPAADIGKLDKIPAKMAKTVRERDQARSQNYWLSKKSFGGAGDNYSQISWRSQRGS